VATWYQRNKDRHKQTCRRNHLRRKYGLTFEQFEAIWVKQGGRCAICAQLLLRDPADSNQDGVKSGHAVDHDHGTGKVRGLLCKLCNQSIGLMNDSPARLRKAAAYLDDHQAESSIG
jgi:Autographiviridae endonuclease VII